MAPVVCLGTTRTRTVHFNSLERRTVMTATTATERGFWCGQMHSDRQCLHVSRREALDHARYFMQEKSSFITKQAEDLKNALNAASTLRNEVSMLASDKVKMGQTIKEMAETIDNLEQALTNMKKAIAKEEENAGADLEEGNPDAQGSEGELEEAHEEHSDAGSEGTSQEVRGDVEPN